MERADGARNGDGLENQGCGCEKQTTQQKASKTHLGCTNIAGKPTAMISRFTFVGFNLLYSRMHEKGLHICEWRWPGKALQLPHSLLDIATLHLDLNLWAGRIPWVQLCCRLPMAVF